MKKVILKPELLTEDDYGKRYIDKINGKTFTSVDKFAMTIIGIAVVVILAHPLIMSLLN